MRGGRDRCRGARRDRRRSRWDRRGGRIRGGGRVRCSGRARLRWFKINFARGLYFAKYGCEILIV